MPLERPSPEQILYSDESVTVTPARIQVGAAAYETGNVTSVRLATVTPSRGNAIAVVAFGALFSLVQLLREQPRIEVIALFALIALFGLVWIALTRTSYAVVVSSSSGEQRALTSCDRAYIEKIVAVIRDALVRT